MLLYHGLDLENTNLYLSTFQFEKFPLLTLIENVTIVKILYQFNCIQNDKTFKNISLELIYIFDIWLCFGLNQIWSTPTTNKYYGGDVSVSYYWFYNFPNQFIWFSVWICIAHFLFHMFSLFWWAVAWIRKDVSTKWKNKFISSK